MVLPWVTVMNCVTGALIYRWYYLRRGLASRRAEPVVAPEVAATPLAPAARGAGC